jgi:hypothetical protein
MQYSEPSPGETIFCWRQSKDFVDNKHILYLGLDSSGAKKILVPHPEEGWSIIDMSCLPTNGYRSIGVCNLEKLKWEGKSLTEAIYIYFDQGEDIKITAKYVDGFWVLLKDFQMPSWVGGENARGTGSKEDCGSDVEISDRENLNEDSST